MGQDQWDAQPWPSLQPAAPVAQPEGGQWMYCKDWCNCPPCVNGWVFVQGYFQWGVALTWHIQRAAFFDVGSLWWICMLWKEEGGEWTVSLVKQQKISFDEQQRIPDWKIHEPAGGAAHAHKRLREIYTYSLKKSIYI